MSLSSSSSTSDTTGTYYGQVASIRRYSRRQQQDDMSLTPFNHHDHEQQSLSIQAQAQAQYAYHLNNHLQFSNQSSNVQRQAANMRERRRMQSINDAFEGLRLQLPTLPYEKKISKVDTLKMAIGYINFLTDLLNKDTRYNGQSAANKEVKKFIYVFRNFDYPNGVAGHSLSWQNRRELHPNTNKVFSSRLWTIPAAGEADAENLTKFSMACVTNSSPVSLTPNETRRRNDKTDLKYSSKIRFSEASEGSEDEEEDDDDIIEDGVVNYDEIIDEEEDENETRRGLGQEDGRLQAKPNILQAINMNNNNKSSLNNESESISSPTAFHNYTNPMIKSDSSSSSNMTVDSASYSGYGESMPMGYEYSGGNSASVAHSLAYGDSYSAAAAAISGIAAAYVGYSRDHHLAAVSYNK